MNGNITPVQINAAVLELELRTEGSNATNHHGGSTGGWERDNAEYPFHAIETASCCIRQKAGVKPGEFAGESNNPEESKRTNGPSGKGKFAARASSYPFSVHCLVSVSMSSV